MDSRPEPHSRFTVNAGTDAGTPALSAATRATLTASAGWAMLPTITWSRLAGSNAVRARSSAITIRPSESAGTSLSSVPAREYGVRTPSTRTTSRDMRLAGRLVHVLDQLVVTALEDPPLDLEGRRDRAILHGQLRRQQGEGADLLVVRLLRVVRVDLGLEEPPDVRIRVEGVELQGPAGRS